MDTTTKKDNGMKPKVSIIVPCYNVEKYLDQCMNNLVNQSLQEIEIILVDDGSPDRVPEMCDEWAMKDNRIKVIHKKNEGLGYARNSGLEIAMGEYVTFVDSDDYVATDTYRIAYEEAQKANACAVFFGIQNEYKKGKWSIQKIYEKQIWEGEQVTDYILDMIACAPYVKEERKWYMSTCCGIYRHFIINENNVHFLSERYYLCEDLLFNISFLGYANKIIYVPKTLYYYCLNSSSITTTFRVDTYDRLLCLYKLLIQKTVEIKGSRERVDRCFIGIARVYIVALVTSHHNRKRTMLNRVLNDGIWDELRVRYTPNWLPLYQNVFYRLILGKYSRLLMGYVYLASIIRNHFIKKR